MVGIITTYSYIIHGSTVFLPPLTKPVLLFRLRRFLSTFSANSLRSDKLRKPKLCSPDSRISGWRSLAEEMTVSACKFIQVNTPDIFDDCLLPDYIQKCKQEPGEASVISHALIIAAGIVWMPQAWVMQEQRLINEQRNPETQPRFLVAFLYYKKAVAISIFGGISVS